MSQRDDFDQPTNDEGVRILGAEEARQVLEGGHDAEPEPGPVRRLPERGRDAEAARSRFLLPEDDDAGPSWSASSSGFESTPGAAREEPSGPIELPHWTEPPTGEMPAIFVVDPPDADDDDDDLAAWVAVTGSTPRLRDTAADWAEADYDFSETESLKDESVSVGALVGALDDADTALDDDEAFERQVAARRRGGSRRVATGATATVVDEEPTTTGASGPRPPRRRPEPREPAPTTGGGGGGRDLPVALLTAAAVAIVALLCLNAGPLPTMILAAVIVGLGALDLANGLRPYRPASLLAALGSVALVAAAYWRGEAAFPIVAALVVVFTLLWYLAEVTPGRPVAGIGTTLLTFGYVGLLGGFAGLILGVYGDNGIGIILGLAICVIAYDAVGYFVGSQFGKTPLAPRVSPNKTWEGLLGGMVASVAFGFGVAGMIDPWGRGSGLALGVLIAVAAPLGDLCESMIKRDLGIKDFGSLLPGHGGVLDRFDAILFVLPAVYYLARFLDLTPLPT